MFRNKKRSIIAIGIIVCTLLIISGCEIHPPKMPEHKEPPHWDTINLDISRNGNIWDAVNVLEDATPEETKENAIEEDLTTVMKYTDEYFGQYLKYTGEIVTTHQYPPKTNFTYKVNHGGPVGEIQLALPGIGFAVRYLHLGSIDDIKIGDTITFYGLIIGYLETEVPSGKTIKQPLIVGKAYDKQTQ